MSTNEKLIVIGGTAAGLSAASKAKRLCPDMDVVVFERSGFVSYGSCGLPYYVGDMIKEPDDLVSLTADQLRSKRRIETCIYHQVLQINKEEKHVLVKNLKDDSTFTAAYDYLVIATGARPVIPQIPGIDFAGVHYLRTVEDGISLKTAAQSGAKHAVIVGGGFIGLEVAEQLCDSGLQVELVEAMPRLMPFLCEEYSNMIRKALEDKGVGVHTGAFVESLTGKDGRVSGLKTSVGLELKADLVLMSAGAAPESALARGCGLELGIRQAIAVDETQQTSDPHIWACGDCVQVTQLITGKPAYVPLGTTANKQGRIAGGNIAGEKGAFKGVLGSMTTKVFELYIAVTGLSLAQALAEGFEAASASIVKSDKASYYPGGRDNYLTLVFERKGGRLLGAQGVGSISIVGRINVLVAAITAGMTVEQLNELDMAYSPSVAPVYDPLLIAAAQALKQVTERDGYE